jgi:hypothetical protein
VELGSSIHRSCYFRLAVTLAMYESLLPEHQKYDVGCKDDMFYSALAFSSAEPEELTGCKFLQHKCSIFLEQNNICKWLFCYIFSLFPNFRCKDLDFFEGPSANPLWVNGSLYICSSVTFFFVAFKTRFIHVAECRFSSLKNDLEERQPSLLLWNETLLTVSKVSWFVQR